MIWLISLGCLVAFIAGIFLLVSIMPRLIKRAVDDALFIGVAAVAIFGAMLAFGSIGVTFAVFSGSIGVRIINAIMLIVLGVVTLRTALGAFRSRSYSNAQSDQRLTRLIVGSFFLLLTVTALALLVLLFVPS